MVGRLMVAAAVIGGAVIGAAGSAYASSKAGGAQTKAANSSIDFQRESRDISLNLQAPQRNAGYAATAALMDLTGLSRAGTGGGKAVDGYSAPDLSAYPTYDWQKNDPGYQFRLDEGNKAITNSLAARGGVLSGGGVKAALRYSQDYASNEYQNVYNRIASIAGFGQTANNQSQGAVTNAANQTSAAITNAGDARASSYVAQGNAVANAGNQIGQYYGYQQYGGYQPAFAQGNGTFDASGGYHGNLPGQQ